jgi:hypothetical protein
MLPALFSRQEIVSWASVSTSQLTHFVSITETNRINVHRTYGEQGCTNFPKIWELPQNSRCQMGDMKFHTEDPQILGTTKQNLVTTAT